MKKLLLFILAVLIFQTGFSQTPADTSKAKPDSVVAAPPPAKERRDTRPLKERIDFGFGSAFWITSSQTYIEVAPVVAYRFPKRLITGIGYRYIYRHDRIFDRDLNAYGPNVFAQLNVTRRIYLWTEYETLHNEYLTEDIVGLTKNKATTDSWFAGIGYVKALGKSGRGGLSFQVLYNFLYEDNDTNPYYSPVTYRVGYFF